MCNCVLEWKILEIFIFSDIKLRDKFCKMETFKILYSLSFRNPLGREILRMFYCSFTLFILLSWHLVLNVTY
jgi:hypothetical protein